MTAARRTAPYRLADAFAVLLASLALLWPAFVNGRPPVFADTAYYISLGEYASEHLGLIGPAQRIVAPDDPTRLGRGEAGRPTLAYTLMGARAPTYALFLYWTQRAGGLWLTAWLQALAAAWSLWLLAKGFAPRRRLLAFAGASAAATLLTPLPFFAPFAMPDVWGGIAAALGIALLALPDRLGRWERGGAAALLLFALSVHGSHPLIAAAFAVFGGLILLLLSADAKTTVVAAGALIGLAVASIVIDAAGFAALSRAGGVAITRPPFLTARLLADRPGRRYLRQACAADPNAWVICPDAGKRLTNSEHILWRDERWLGVFSPSSFERRRAISAQDGRFARAVLLHDPLGVLATSLENWRRQLVRGFVDDPLTNQGFWMQHVYWIRTNLERISVDTAPCLTYYGCPSRIPFKPVKRLHLWVQALAAAWLTLRLAAEGVARARDRARPLWSEPRVGLFAAAALALGVVLINAAVCGMISGPFPRYQARIAWLLPVAAVLLGIGLFPRRSRRPELDLPAP